MHSLSKEFNKISHYKRHLNRKNKCIEKPLVNSVINHVPLMEQCNNNRHVCNFVIEAIQENQIPNKHLKTCKVKIEKELKKHI